MAKNTTKLLSGIFCISAMAGCGNNTRDMPSPTPGPVAAPAIIVRAPATPPALKVNPVTVTMQKITRDFSGPELTFTLPDGSTVQVDADLLGPNFAITGGFLIQLDPHAAPTVDMTSLDPAQRRRVELIRASKEILRAETNPETLAGIFDYLEQAHGLTRLKIQDLRQQCENIILSPALAK